MHSMLWWSFPIQSILECLNCAVTYCPQDGLVPLTERMESSQVGHPYLSTPFAEVHTWVCQPFQAVTRYVHLGRDDPWVWHAWCLQAAAAENRRKPVRGCSRRLEAGGRGDPVFLDLANPPRSFLRRKVFSRILASVSGGQKRGGQLISDICLPVLWIRLLELCSKYCRSCWIRETASGMQWQFGLFCRGKNVTWPSPTLKLRLSRKYGSFLPRSPWFQVGLVQTWKSLGWPSPQGDFWDWPIFSENRSETVQKQTKELCWEKEPWKPRRGWRIWGGHYKLD